MLSEITIMLLCSVCHTQFSSGFGLRRRLGCSTVIPHHFEKKKCINSVNFDGNKKYTDNLCFLDVSIWNYGVNVRIIYKNAVHVCVSQCVSYFGSAKPIRKINQCRFLQGCNTSRFTSLGKDIQYSCDSVHIGPKQEIKSRFSVIQQIISAFRFMPCW